MTDPSEPFDPKTLFEFIGENIHRAKSRGPTPRREAASSNDLPLIDEDGLRFRFVPLAQDGGACPAEGQAAGDAGVLTSAFRKAFADTWNRIPEAERRLMLVYWRSRAARPESVKAMGNQRWPLIQIKDDGRYSPTPVYPELRGFSMTFSAWFVATQTACLPGVIARLLAQVCRLASGLHGRQVVQMIEEPLARWQREQGDQATEEQEEQKGLALETAFMEDFEASIVQILHSWGLGGI